MRIEVDRSPINHQSVIRVVVSDLDYETVPAHCLRLLRDAQKIPDMLFALGEMAAWLEKEAQAPAGIEVEWEVVGVDMARIGSESQSVKGLLTDGKRG